MSQHKPGRTLLSKYGFLWVTSFLFISSLVGHWTLAWHAFVNEAAQHGQSPETRDFVVVTMRDTLENWQSEFLQLIWQVAGLALLYHLGSPQSKEGNDRLEEKVDLILGAVVTDGANEIERLDHIYQRDVIRRQSITLDIHELSENVLDLHEVFRVLHDLIDVLVRSGDLI